MPRRDAESRCIRQWVDRRRIEYHPLLLQSTEQTIGNFRDMLAAEHADKLIDIWSRFEQRLLLPFCQAARDDDAANFAAAFEVEHFVNRGKRFGAGGFDKTARVHDGEIGVLRIVDELISIELKQAEHPFAVDKILWATQADERVFALRRTAGEFVGESVYHVTERQPRNRERGTA